MWKKFSGLILVLSCIISFFLAIPTYAANENVSGGTARIFTIKNPKEELTDVHFALQYSGSCTVEIWKNPLDSEYGPRSGDLMFTQKFNNDIYNTEHVTGNWDEYPNSVTLTPPVNLVSGDRVSVVVLGYVDTSLIGKGVSMTTKTVDEFSTSGQTIKSKWGYRTPASDGMVISVPSKVYYSDNMQIPNVTVTDTKPIKTSGSSASTVSLIKDTDFTVTVIGGSYNQIGTCTLRITGKGKYAGSGSEVNYADVTYSIIDKSKIVSDTSIAVAKQKMDISSQFKDAAIVRYRINDPEQRRIASVNNRGIVTAKKSGTVTITAYTKEGKIYTEAGTYTMDIEKPVLKKMEATYAGQIIYAGDNLSGLTKAMVTSWQSSRPSVATIDENTGAITALTRGSTTITAVFGEGKNAAKYRVSFKCSVPKMNKKILTMKTGYTSILKMNNTKITPVWSISNNSIASFEVRTNGSCAVTAKNAGTSDVIATIDGIQYVCELTVLEPQIRQASITMKLGQTKRLSLKNTKLVPEWTSSDTKIAPVNGAGYIAANGRGTAIIYTTTGGVRNECTVTIY